MIRLSSRMILSSVAAIATCASLAGQTSAYQVNWNGGGGDGNYMTANNWESPSYPGAHFAPDTGSSVNLIDDIATANVTLYSGTSTILDFSAWANHGPGADTVFTVKSGATLHSTNNFDIGYFNGPETVTFTLESGATTIVDGYFGGGRAGPHTSYIDGLLNTHILHIGGADQINLGSTGMIVADDDHFHEGPASFATDLNTWIGQGLITAPSGYAVNHAFDSGTGKTTISAVAVPEPISGSVLAMGLAVLMRRQTRTGARQQL